MTDLRHQAVELVRKHGYERREKPFLLASGESSNDYIDGKFAVDNGPALRLVSQAIVELAQAEKIAFDAVGGLTMGADALAHGICMVAECQWFSVRKQAKRRGRQAWIEGCRLDHSHRVLLVDDVVSFGGSIKDAYERVVETGATVAGAIPMVDRGENAAPWFAGLGIPYVPLMTYRHLQIDPLRGNPHSSPG